MDVPLTARGERGVMYEAFQFMSQLQNQKVPVLLVDDSADDRMLFKLAMGQSQSLSLVAELEDGDEAICYLKGEGIYADRAKYPLPDLMLLDLKMPRVSGYEVLTWFKHHGPRTVTVIILSGSTAREDVSKAMSLGADFYQMKPKNTEDRVAMLRAVEAYLLRRREGARC